ncbi:Pfs NB-ARC ankyrin-domain-containing protein [Fusarium napiforme]|uniref:Pfs NB-ARC ankyrin-domain-containing protein n=1 Tax=Fusarium napiforme TaxID=42672 RepID=A0A8H5NGA6_9HYPO|nr:Pfs NB-ARC ankyrin-domain-containing protein [Fusarium napiforme]
MSGIEAVGLVSGILTILETIGKLSDAIKNAKDLPPAFREVADKLPIVRDILQAVEKHLSTSSDQGTDEAIKAVLKHCRDKAEKLEKLFKAVDPSEDTSSFRRYSSMVRSLGKGHRVEVLSKGMMEDVKLLVQNHAAQAATETQVAKLSEAIQEISSVEPSLAEEEAVTQTHYGSGDNVAGNKHVGNHNEYSGSGTAYFGSVTQHVNSQPRTKPSLSDLLLRSLVFDEMNIRPTQIKPEAAGTCRWIFQHKIYRKWQSRDRSLLWLKGKPGSGKSTLLRYILDNIITSTSSKERPLVLSFFFSGRGTELQKTPDGLYRSLLCQMESQIPQALEAMVARFRQIHTQSDTYEERWNTSELRSYTRTSIWKALETHPIILFVDALDECGQKSAEQLAEEFNSLLHWPSSKCLKHFRICFTCRHYPVVDIDAGFEICVDRENARDISLFVESKLRPFQEQTGSIISEYISQHAEGVFLWASLVVGKVLSLDRDRLETAMVESEVRQVPRSLEKLYSEIIGQIDEKSTELIECICFSARPLTLVELHWAMVLAQNKDFHSLREFEGLEHLRFNCAAMKWKFELFGHGLIECQTSGGVVQFIHQSVKDFVMEKVLPSLRKSTDPEQAPHYCLAKICLRYLGMVEDYQVADVKAKSVFPFLSYAKSSWELHITHIPDDLQESLPWPWGALVNRDYQGHIFPTSTTLLHRMSMKGYVGALRGILARRNESSIDVDLKDHYGRTPLHIAIIYGRISVVKLLLENGAQPNICGMLGWTSLHYATQLYDTTVMKLLLGSGAITNAKADCGSSPLSFAIENGHIAAIELLLERGAQVDHDYEVGYKPLSDDSLYREILSQASLPGLFVALRKASRGPFAALAIHA